MKLNKPPVSEEQTLLEEYVDFLLTDLTNVTPISTRQKVKTERDEDSELNQKDTEKKQLIVEVIKSQESQSGAVDSNAKSETAEVESFVESELLEAERAEAERAEAERAEAERAEAERAEAEKIEAERAQAERAEAEKIEAERAEAERAQAERIEAERIEAERIEAERIEAEKKALQQKDSEPHIAHAEDDYSLEAEEEEARLWDEVITKEKEEAILQEMQQEEGEQQHQNELSEFISGEPTSPEVQDISTPKSNAEELGSYSERPAAETEKYHRKVETKRIEKVVEPPLKEQDERLANVEKLLARISLATKPQTDVTTALKTEKKQAEVVEQERKISQEAAVATFVHRDAEKLKNILPDVFQTLIFKVGKMPLAVPLLKLGGIVKISDEDITPLVGTPDWFMGLIPNDRGNLMVIDTQKYIMPEQPVVASKDMGYEYLIILDNSNWALACNSVGDAKNLTSDDIRWSEKSSKRPWFAGMVVDYMSALIEVDELINMLADEIAD